MLMSRETHVGGEEGIEGDAPITNMAMGRNS